MLLGRNPIRALIEGDEPAPEIAPRPVVANARSVGVECPAHQLTLIVERIGLIVDRRLSGCGDKRRGIEIVIVRGAAIILNGAPSGFKDAERSVVFLPVLLEKAGVFVGARALVTEVVPEGTLFPTVKAGELLDARQRYAVLIVVAPGTILANPTALDVLPELVAVRELRDIIGKVSTVIPC